MSKLKHPVTLAAIGATVVILILIGTTLYTRHHTNSKTNTAKTTAVKTTKAATTTAKRSNDTQQSNSSSSTTPAKTQAADQAASAGTAQPVTDACKLLSKGAAQQVVGANAQTATAKSTSATQASDTVITSCAYSGSNGSVQLTVRTPSGQLGTSENDTAFGSGKPSSAMVVQGYGQSAYWDPGTHELNILGNNNWYVITRNTGAQTDTEAVAKLLAQGF